MNIVLISKWYCTKIALLLKKGPQSAAWNYSVTEDKSIVFESWKHFPALLYNYCIN